MTVQSNKDHSVPFPRSYWVIPGQVLAGYYPGSNSEGKARRKFQALLDHGIRHFINLMEADEENWDGEPFVPYEDQIKPFSASVGHAVSFNRMPIRDLDVPSTQEMRQILNRIDQSVEDEKPIYFHCWGGRGRTGTVAGCFMARHGIALGQSALQRIEELRKNTEDYDKPSPQTPEQCYMVSSWVEGE